LVEVSVKVAWNSPARPEKADSRRLPQRRKGRTGFGLFMITRKANPMVQGHDKTNPLP